MNVNNNRSGRGFFDGNPGRDWTPAERAKLRREAEKMKPILQQKLGELPSSPDVLPKIDLSNSNRGKGFLA